MIGKQVRLGKLFDTSTNKIFMVPMDHGVTLGPLAGIKDAAETIRKIHRGGAKTFVLHKGIMREMANYRDILSDCNFILHLSASSDFTDHSYAKRLVSTVEQAVKMGATGVSVHVNLNNEYEGQMLEDLGKVSDACMNWGMPLLAMMYVRDNERESLQTHHVAHAARIAQELGADIVKVNSLSLQDDIKDVVESVSIPVIVSGGPSITTEKLLLNVYQAMKAGAAGVAIGRNIFQSRNPEIITALLLKMMNAQFSYEEAMLELEKVKTLKYIS